jgi:hypothetical protein
MDSLKSIEKLVVFMVRYTLAKGSGTHHERIFKPTHKHHFRIVELAD